MSSGKKLRKAVVKMKARRFASSLPDAQTAHARLALGANVSRAASGAIQTFASTDLTDTPADRE